MCNSYYVCLFALLLNQIILFVLGVLTLIVGLTSKISLEGLHPSLERILSLIKISEIAGLILRYVGWIFIAFSIFWAYPVYNKSPLSTIQVPLTTTPTPISTTAVATATPSTSATSLSTSTLHNIPSVSLVSVSYIAGDWDPRLIDLRTSSTSGIPVNPGDSLSLFDLWVNVHVDANGYDIYANVIDSNGVEIGKTNGQKVTTGSFMKLDNFVLENFADSSVKNAWQTQSDWKSLDVYIYLFDGPNKISTSKNTINIDPNGSAWMITPPYSNFVAIEYSVNNKPPRMMDLSKVTDNGLPIYFGDKLSITGIWIKANTNSYGHQIKVEAYLNQDGHDSSTSIYSPFFYQDQGIAEMPNLTKFKWTIPEGKISLVLILSRDDRTVLDRYVIPF